MSKMIRGTQGTSEINAGPSLSRGARGHGAAWCCAALLAGTLFAAAPARAQGSRKDDIVFNAQGRPMAGANVRVCTANATGQPCAPLANIYSDAALTQALANPTATDGLGNYSFYAAPGRYMIEISGPGITTKQLPNVILPNDPSAPTFTSLTTTSGISAFSLSLSGNLTVTGSTAVAGTLTVGGAAVPSTGQANTWSAAQTFSQGPIFGSGTPHTDVRANGAKCDGSTDDGTPLANTVNAMATNGGDTYVPGNCVATLPSSFSAMTQYSTVTLGGLFTPKTTFHVSSNMELNCDHPALNGTYGGGAPFQDRALCFVIAPSFSTNPVITATAGGAALSGLGLTAFNGVGIQLAHSNVRVDHVFSQSESNTATPCLISGGFGYYFNGGGCTQSTLIGPPSLILDNPASGLGACDVPRISQFDHTFFDTKGVHLTNECASPTPSEGIRFIQNLYENVDEPFLNIEGSVGNTARRWELYGVQMSDPASGALLQPLIHVAAGSQAAGFFVVNPYVGSTIYQIPGGEHADANTGSVIINGGGAVHGIYGRYHNAYYSEFNRAGSLTTSRAMSNAAQTASAEFIGGMVVPLAPPYMLPTPSASGGSLATGTYYIMVAGVVGSSEGPPSANSDPISVTGPTGSISVQLPDPTAISDSATTYHIYCGTQPIDQQTGTTTYFTSTLASSFVITNCGGGTSGVPLQLENDPSGVASTAYLSPTANSSSYMGTANCVAFGKRSCTTNTPGSIETTSNITSSGTVSGSNVPSMAGAANGDYPCFNGTMVKCTPGTAENTQSGGTYAIASSDRLAWVKRTNTSSSTDTLSLPTVSGFGSGFGFTYLCWGTAACNLTDPGGTFTINGTSGLTSLALQPGDIALITTDTSTNYNVQTIVRNALVGSSLTAPAGGDLTLAAGSGTQQNILLKPTGSNGYVALDAEDSSHCAFASRPGPLLFVILADFSGYCPVQFGTYITANGDTFLSRGGGGIFKIGTSSGGTDGLLELTAVGSGSASNTDLDGELTMSSGTATYTFSRTYTSHPECVASDQTAIAAVKVTYTAATSVTFTTAGASDVVSYICMARN